MQPVLKVGDIGFNCCKIAAETGLALTQLVALFLILAQLLEKGIGPLIALVSGAAFLHYLMCSTRKVQGVKMLLQALLGIFISVFTLLTLVLKLLQLLPLLFQGSQAFFALRKLLCPENVLFFVFTVLLACLVQRSTPGFQFACLIGQASDLKLLRLRLFFVELLHIQ